MLLFKDIKQNYPVWMLDKQGLDLIQGKVTQVSFPHIDSGRVNLGTSHPLVVDVTILANGKTATYTIPENLCITDAGSSLVLSTEKENLIHEIEAMKNSAQQVLSSIDRQKDIVKRSDELLLEINPEIKEKIRYEERFKSLESGMEDIKELLHKFLKNDDKKTNHQDSHS